MLRGISVPIKLSFNIPSVGNTQGIWIFHKICVQIPPSPGQKAIQMPHRSISGH